MAKVTFNNKNNAFFVSLKQAVDQYFIENKISKTGDWRLYLKTFILLTGAVTLYTILVFFTPVWYIALPLCILIGFTFSGIGFNVMHDANHGSFSKNKTLNYILGMSSDVLGANSFLWRQKHNVIHHTYTNIDNIDDDIAKSPIIRQCHTQKWVPAHKFQHIYMVFVYCISSFAWTFIMDPTKYFQKKINGTPLQKMAVIDHIIFWVSKVIVVTLYIALPIYTVGFASWIIGYVVFQCFHGFSLAVVFQCAHVIEETEFDVADLDAKSIDNAWAEHQVKTTANFAPQNKIINWYVGGLNFQVEHHLFPRISHVHYPAISEIVKSKCNEFGLPYLTLPTMWSAVSSHFKFMKQLGAQP